MSIKYSWRDLLSVCGNTMPPWMGLSVGDWVFQSMSGRLKSPANQIFLEGSILEKDSSSDCRHSKFELGGR